MPIIAVAAAAISVAGVGAAGFGAILAGTASIGTMMAGVAAVGATLGAIGAVAGIDELKTAGMVLGGIGGVGAIASSVGAFGANATMASVFGGAEAAVGQNLAETGTSLLNGAMQPSVTQDLMSGFIDNGFNSSGIVEAANNIGGFGDVLATTVKMPGADGLSKAVDLAGSASNALKPVTDNITEGPTNEDNTQPVGGEGDVAMAGGPSGPLDPLKVTGKVNVPGAAEGGGMFGKNGFFNTMGGMGVIQAAGSFLSGAFDEVKPAQAEAYKAQAAANNAAAALQNKQVSNMNEPIPVARRVAVTGRPGSLMNAVPAAGAA